MRTYEINVWRDKRVIEKVVREFENDDKVKDYIKSKWDSGNELPRLDQERGFLRPKTKDDIITWSKISTYIRKRGPKRIELTAEEKEIQGRGENLGERRRRRRRWGPEP